MCPRSVAGYARQPTCKLKGTRTRGPSAIALTLSTPSTTSRHQLLPSSRNVRVARRPSTSFGFSKASPRNLSASRHLASSVRLAGTKRWRKCLACGFLWRGVYLFKLPTWSRRIKVALDWFWDFLFPRDLSFLNTDATQYLNRAYYRPGDFIHRQGEVARVF